MKKMFIEHQWATAAEKVESCAENDCHPGTEKSCAQLVSSDVYQRTVDILVECSNTHQSF